MARLPQPGGDNGNWGTILNDYLAQTHKSDGTLKDNVVSAAAITDGSIGETLLDAALQSKVNAGAPDATASTRGVVQLAGDLGGSATSPTVPGLSDKVAKGSLMFNVKDYGAVGNGSTDDGAAIESALSALVALTTAYNAVGVLYFPPGKYIDSAVHTIPTNKRIHVRGAGMDTTILTRPSGAAGGDWWTFNCKTSGMQGFTLEGGRYQGVTGDALVLNGAYTYAHDMWITKAGGNGITIGKAGAAIVHRLTNIFSRENAARGIETIAASGCTDGEWVNIEVGNSGQYGVYLGTGSQNITNLHVWGSGLEHSSQFDGVFIAAGSNMFTNVQSEKNLGRGYRIESNSNVMRGEAWGNCLGAIYMVGASQNEIDMLAFRNSVLNTSGSTSDSYAQCFLSSSSTRNRIRMKVWDSSGTLTAGSYTTAPTYPYPGRTAVYTHARAYVEANANCDYNVIDIDAPRDLTRLSSGTAPYVCLGVNDLFSSSCNWGTNVPLPTQSVVGGAVRIPADSDTIIVSASQEITSVLGARQGRVARIIWTNASPQPIRDNGTTLNLNGDFSPTQHSTLALVSDGTNWYEMSRSTN